MSPGALRPEEQRLVEGLHGIPPSPLRERVLTLVSEIVAFAASPSCAETQADGVPCTSAHVSCDECRKITGLLDGLRDRLRADQ